MSDCIRETRSVCPVCLKNLPARLLREADGRFLLEKSCPAHGRFSVPVWQGRMDFERWLLGAPPLTEGLALGCPRDCGLCAEHESGSCCVLLEVTERCNLHCRFCFAHGGEGACEPGLDELKAAVLAEYPDADVRTAYIGALIGAHTGPGMLALIHWGEKR